MKTINMEIRGVFEEWSEYASAKQLRQRHFPLQKVISYAEDKIVTLTGVRRSGKSSLMMLLFQLLRSRGKRVAYLNAEDPRLEPFNALDEFLAWFGDDGYLLIDEVTSVPGWDGWLARVHELTKPNLHLIVTSSKSYLQTPSRSLRGRSLHLDVHPLTFAERLSFKGITIPRTMAGGGVLDRELQDHLKYGGFPEVVLAAEEGKKQDLLTSYFREILSLDVGGAVGMETAVVNQFGRYLLRSPYFSATACHKALQGAGYRLGKEKVLAMETAAADCLLFHFLSVHSHSIKALNRYARKVHPGDLGFHWSVAGSEDQGRKLETLVFLEVMNARSYGDDIAYWRNAKGQEVDLLLLSQGKVRQAIQVCYDISDQKTMKREVDGLVQCSQDLQVEECLIINKDRSGEIDIDGRKVRLLSVMDFLSSGDVPLPRKPHP